MRAAIIIVVASLALVGVGSAVPTASAYVCAAVPLVGGNPCCTEVHTGACQGCDFQIWDNCYLELNG